MSPLRGSLLIFAVMCAAVTTHGQAVTANLQGVVSDATGAVVSAATVTDANLETGEKRSVLSNAEASTASTYCLADHTKCALRKRDSLTKACRSRSQWVTLSRRISR